ncbi:superoxide dismutase [Fe] [Candidatus Legionella polyplacis]|uniref:superoxide dismutase n=1 Tax=Candidatus Legionella polyplacis TaxID=2005262 RepID=UPI000C1DCE07|nr:Fe-Mn family superoxide dismutase [Candidatus Legionella polyplacis]ATW01945.1 superoxide dismutase [Fe] [Candidatus Legionella polyplacis]
MSFDLSPLPYEMDALVPFLSKETIFFHYEKHHRAYLNNLNRLIIDTQYKSSTLEDILQCSSGDLFNNAAQVWNHTFYWKCLSPVGGGNPVGKVRDIIISNFGSFDKFKDNFTNSSLSFFGSGWIWLVLDSRDNSIKIETTINAYNPLIQGKTPLLTFDLWEHAYYIDYRNSRIDYINSFWSLVNWEFVNSKIC